MTSIRCQRVFQPRLSGLSTFIILTLCFTGGATRTWADQPGSAKAKATTVHCGAGQSINHALRRAAPGETIRVRGTCHERVVITKPVTLNGGGSAVIDGAGVQAVDPGVRRTGRDQWGQQRQPCRVDHSEWQHQRHLRFPWRRRRLERRHDSAQRLRRHRRQRQLDGRSHRLCDPVERGRRLRRVHQLEHDSPRHLRRQQQRYRPAERSTGSRWWSFVARR